MRSLPPTSPAAAPEPVTFGRRLAVARDVFVAPARAFATLQTAPTWVLAYALVLVSSAIYMLLTQNAVTHLTALLDPKIGPHPTATQLADVATRSIEVNGFQNAIQPLVLWGLTATVFTLVARLRGKPVSFRAVFALAANCSLPSALGSLAGAVAVALHPADSFTSLRAFAIAVPDNLAVFAPADHNAEADFLANFGVFDLWSAILLAYGFVAFAQVRLTTALVLSLGIDVLFVLYTVVP